MFSLFLSLFCNPRWSRFLAVSVRSLWTFILILAVAEWTVIVWQLAAQNWLLYNSWQLLTAWFCSFSLHVQRVQHCQLAYQSCCSACWQRLNVDVTDNVPSSVLLLKIGNYPLVRGLNQRCRVWGQKNQLHVCQLDVISVGSAVVT